MKWTTNELENIISLIKNGKTYDEISKLTGRNKNSIRVKMGKIGENFIKYNQPSKKVCKQCDKEIINFGKTFCSTSCSISYNNRLRKSKKISVVCLTCDINFLSHKHDAKFCGRKCFNLNRKKIKDEEIENGVCGTSDTKIYKKYLYKKHGEKCMKCGWCQINKHTKKTPLELHHVDGNSDNNNLSNLEILCPNCHSLTKDWKGGKNNGGRYSKRRIKRRQDYKDGKSA